MNNMKVHEVRIVETLERVVEVQAEDYIDARLLVEEMYRGSEIVLDAGDFGGVKFKKAKD